MELVVEEISEAERAKEQRKENKRLKKKKRKENKAKLIEEKATELEEEKKSVIENDEKSTNNTTDNCVDDIVEYSESLDDSEKSSSESQVSPRKTDDDEGSPELVNHDYSVTLPAHSPTGLLTVSVDDDSSSVSSKETSVDQCESECSDLSPKCDHSSINTKSMQVSDSCKSESQNCKINFATKDSKFSSSTPPYKLCSQTSTRKVMNCHSCGSEDTDKTKKNSQQCKCDPDTSKHHSKRNGYAHHQDYRNNQYKSFNKRNNHNCGSCTSTMGPRFNRCEDHSRWKSDSSGYQADVYDKCFVVNNGSVSGRGRGKRRMYKQKVLDIFLLLLELCSISICISLRVRVYACILP